MADAVPFSALPPSRQLHSDSETLARSLARLPRDYTLAQRGLVCFGAACKEVNSRLFHVIYLQIQETKREP